MKESRHKKRWTQEEDIYLEAHWGMKSIQHISKKLGRTERSITYRVTTLGLGGAYHSGIFLSASEVAKMLNIHKSVVCSWIKEKGLLARKHILIKDKYYKIKTENLKEWLKNNQKLWNANSLPFMALGLEEDWLKEKRKKDSCIAKKRTPYTKEDDRKIITMYMNGFTDAEISREVKRSYDSIKNRITYLREENDLPYRYGKVHTEKRGA